MGERLSPKVLAAQSAVGLCLGGQPAPAGGSRPQNWGTEMTIAHSSAVRSGRSEEASRMRLVVIAASLGTVFEWYDFFLYGSLAAFFSTLFYPPGNDTAAFLASLATFGAGFAVRPFGALVFGGLSDRI